MSFWTADSLALLHPILESSGDPVPIQHVSEWKYFSGKVRDTPRVRPFPFPGVQPHALLCTSLLFPMGEVLGDPTEAWGVEGQGRDGKRTLRDWEGRWTKAERLGAGAGQPHTPQKAWKAGASISSLWRVLRKFGGGALGSLLFWEGERTAPKPGPLWEMFWFLNQREEPRACNCMLTV